MKLSTTSSLILAAIFFSYSLATNFSVKLCGASDIRGCGECQPETSSTKGCSKCVEGAGIEIRDNFRYCIPCPITNCTNCEITAQGRQCQKCEKGLKFDEYSQTCYSGSMSNFNLYLPVLLFLVVKL